MHAGVASRLFRILISPTVALDLPKDAGRRNLSVPAMLTGSHCKLTLLSSVCVCVCVCACVCVAS